MRCYAKGMPESSELFDLNRRHLIGRLITATVSSGRIADISLPSENRFKHMLVLSAADFSLNPNVKIMEVDFPIFARDEVFFKGQPILAVFGYEIEDVDLFCNEVKVSYQIKADSEEYKCEEYGQPFIWGYGNVDEFFTQKTKTFKSHFEVSPFTNTMHGDQRVFAVKQDNNMIVKVETQWPIHVKQSIASCIGYNLENIIIDSQNYYAPSDQSVIQPSIISCIAAMAAEQSNELVQLCCPMISWQPRMIIEHETAYLAEGGTPLADKATCTVDLGAFPVFTTEVCHNILAGLISVYPLKAISVNINILRSTSFPANFFGDLGYSMALASTENHYTNLAASLGMQPGIWKYQQVKNLDDNGFALCQAVKESKNFSKLPATLKNVMDNSWYSRKFAANMQRRLNGKSLNPLVNYSRGIGLACGEGIMGFSQQFNSIAKYAIDVTLTEDHKIIVNAGITTDRFMVSIWKNTIKQFIPVRDEDIIFLDINTPNIKDLGPSTLSRKMGLVSSLLLQACAELKNKQDGPLPVTQTAVYEADFSDPFYFSSSIGSVAVDLHIDTVMLAPVIDNIWLSFHMGHVFNKERLYNKARHTITTVLSDICPRTSGKCNVYLDIEQDGNYSASSLTAGLRGLVTAALINALSQALGHTIDKIPLTSDDILSIANKPSKGGEK